MATNTSGACTLKEHQRLERMTCLQVIIHCARPWGNQCPETTRQLLESGKCMCHPISFKLVFTGGVSTCVVVLMHTSPHGTSMHTVPVQEGCRGSRLG